MGPWRHMYIYIYIYIYIVPTKDSIGVSFRLQGLQLGFCNTFNYKGGRRTRRIQSSQGFS